MIEVRRRITDKFNKQRLELELRRSFKPAIVVAICMIATLAIVAFMLIRISPTTLTSNYNAQFAVADVTGVTAGLTEVRLKGIPVGRVKSIEVKGDQPVLKVQIKSKYGKLYQDARATLRPTTALQDMYLDILDRGHASAGVLKSGDVLDEGRTQTAVSVDDVLNMFTPDTRLRMRTLLDDLGHGMQDRGDSLRSIFVTLAPFVATAGQISDQLADRKQLVKGLVHNTGTLTDELARRDKEIRTLVREGAITLTTTSDSRADLGSTLRELPPTMVALQSSFSAVRGVLPDVDSAVKALYPVADKLSGSLADLRALAKSAQPAIHALRQPVSDLVPFAQAIKPLSIDLATAVDAGAPQIHTVNKVTDDLVKCKTGIQNFFQWNASMSKYGDVRGPIPRGNVVIGAQSSGVLNDPNEVAPQGCGGGKVMGGRVVEQKDKH